MKSHYNDAIMSAMATQITSLMIVYLTVCSNTNQRKHQRKHQSSTSLAFARGIHRWPVNSRHKGPVTFKIFPFDDVIMRFTLQGDKFVRNNQRFNRTLNKNMHPSVASINCCPSQKFSLNMSNIYSSWPVMSKWYLRHYDSYLQCPFIYTNAGKGVRSYKRDSIYVFWGLVYGKLTEELCLLSFDYLIILCPLGLDWLRSHLRFIWWLSAI